MFSLGKKLRCKHSGFEGIAIARLEFINGCVQYSILPKVKKGDNYPKDVYIDQDSLEIVEPKPKKRAVGKLSDCRTGGPTTRGILR